MIGRLVTSELIKLRTMRTTWGFLIAVLLLCGGGAALTAAFLEAFHPGEQGDLLKGVFQTLLILVLCFGIVGAAGEYRHGTAIANFLLTPVRSRVVLGQALAYVVVGAVFAVVAVVITFVIALPVLAIRGIGIGLSISELWPVVVGGILASMIAGALGVGIGALIRDQAAALVGTLIAFFIVLPLVSGISKLNFVDYIPSVASAELIGIDLSSGLTVVGSGLVFLAYAVVFVGLAVLFTEHRDIS